MLRPPWKENARVVLLHKQSTKFNFGSFVYARFEVLPYKNIREAKILKNNMWDKFILTWHAFSSHGQELFRNLLETQ